MATNKKITELPAATLPITTGVKFEAIQGGLNVQVDADDMPGSSGGTSIPFGSTSGTNTYTIAATPAVTAYTNGILLHVKVVAGSTGASTFNFDSVGAKKVYLTPDTQVTVGMLVSNHEYIFTYDSALDSAVGGFLLVGDYNHGLLNSRSNSFDASGGAYPSTLGSGPAGAIKHFDAYMVSVAGQMPGGGPFVKARDWLIALADTPGNTPANWGYILSQKLYTSTGSNTDGSMDQNSITSALALKANLASPALTGAPTAPTASNGTDTTQLATAAFANAVGGPVIVSGNISIADTHHKKTLIVTANCTIDIPTGLRVDLAFDVYVVTGVTLVTFTSSITYESSGGATTLRGGMAASFRMRTTNSIIAAFGQNPASEIMLGVTSDTATTVVTAADVGGLTTTVEESSVYIIKGHIIIGCNNTGGVKLGFVSPSGAEYRITLFGMTTGATAFQRVIMIADGLSSIAFNTVSAAASGFVQIEGTLHLGAGEGGTFKIQFASNTATQTSTVYQVGSYVTLKKLI